MRWLILAVALTLGACTAPQQAARAPAASIVAIAANDVVKILQAEYVRQGEAEIARSHSIEEARERLLALEKRWQQLLRAWDAFAEAHSLWRLAVQASDAASVLAAAGQAQRAYCAVVAASPVELPAMPGVSCADGKAEVRECINGACEFR